MSLKKLIEEITKPLIDEMGIVAGDGTIQGSPSKKKVKKNKTNKMSGYKKVDEIAVRKKPKKFRDIYDALPIDLKKRVMNLKNFDQRRDAHPEGNVLKHTIAVTNRALKTGDIDFALSALFHDIGKDSTAKLHPKKGFWTHYGHEKVSAELVKKHATWIKSMGGDVDTIYYIVKQHMRMKVFDKMKWTKQDKMSKEKHFGKLQKFTKFDKGGRGINEAQAVKGSKVEKFITGHNLTIKGKKYKEIEFETLGIDNSSKMVKLKIIAPKNLFGMETPVKFATIRRGPFTKTDTGKKRNENVEKTLDFHTENVVYSNNENSVSNLKEKKKLSRKDQIKQNKLRDERLKLMRKYTGFGSDAGSSKLKLQIKGIEKQIDKLNEATNIKKTIGVFGGRFQPFHSGHLATYKWLKTQVDEAYITTSDIKKPPRHPMNFKEKVRHMVKVGIPKNRIVMEKSPYVAKNLLNKFDSKTTAVVYVVGEKDAGRLGGKYFKSYTKDMKGFEEHGYIITAPQVGNISGTKTRDMLGNPKVDDKEKLKFFKKTFGYYDKGVYNMMTNKFKKLYEVYRGLFESTVNSR